MGALSEPPRVLVLPGLDGSSALSRPLADELQPDFAVECIAYPSDRATTYAELEDLVRERVEPGPPAVVVAQSFSGPLAMRLAVAVPQALAGVVFCATFARLPMSGAMRVAARAASALGLVRSAAGSPRLIRAFLTGRDAPEELVDAVRDTIDALDPSVLRDRLSQVLDLDASAELARLRVCACHVVGTRDRLLGRSGSGQITRLNPTVPTIAVDAPHLVAQTHPAAVARVVRRLVEK